MEQLFGYGKPQYSRGDHHLWGKIRSSINCRHERDPRLKVLPTVNHILLTAGIQDARQSCLKAWTESQIVG